MNGLVFSARQLLRAPGYLTLATLALALGIGSTTTIFSIVRAVFLRALPYSEPATLMQLTSSVPEQQIDAAGFSYPRYEAVRARQTAFSAMSYAIGTAFTVTGTAEPEQIIGQQAAHDYLPLLGLQPALGRGFTADEDRPGGADVALLSHGLWERGFGARPDVLGQAIILDGRPHTIVGVMPRHANLFPMAQVAIWTPRPQEVSFLVRRQIEGGGFFFTVLARLKPGTSLETARAQVRDIALAYAATHPTNADTKATAEVNPMLDNLVGDQRQTYLILFAAVACLLLIASANVANLALARYAARRRQIAIRCAIGAGRRHVIAEMLSENLVLALAGGALGVLLAAASLEFVKAWAGDQIPRAEEIALDPLVLLFSLSVSLLTGLALSLFPVWQLSKPDVIDALKDGGREVAAGRHHSRMRSTLLVAEVAVSFVLLVAAGLLVASFARLQGVDPKFSAERILVGNIQTPQTRYPDGSEPLVQFYSRLLERVRQIPGVTAVAINDSPPLTGGGPAPFAVVGQSIPPIGQQPVALRHIVSPGAFELLGVRVVRGRDFDASDVLGKPALIIINETMAKQAFPSGDPDRPGSLDRHAAAQGADHRGGGGHPVGGPGDAARGRDVPPRSPATGELHQHPREGGGRRSDVAARGAASSGRRGRSEHSGHQPEPLRDPRESEHRRAADDHEPALVVRDGGAAARGAGRLQRDDLLRGPAHGRDRRAHGARSAPEPGSRHGGEAGAGAHGHRHGHRCRRSAPRHARHARAPVRDPRRRSRDLSRHRDGLQRDRGPRGLDPRAPRRPGGPVDRAPRLGTPRERRLDDRRRESSRKERDKKSTAWAALRGTFGWRSWSPAPSGTTTAASIALGAAVAQATSTPFSSLRGNASLTPLGISGQEPRSRGGQHGVEQRPFGVTVDLLVRELVPAVSR